MQKLQMIKDKSKEQASFFATSSFNMHKNRRIQSLNVSTNYLNSSVIVREDRLEEDLEDEYYT